MRLVTHGCRIKSGMTKHIAGLVLLERLLLDGCRIKSGMTRLIVGFAL
jgi:hypothetical protein